MNTKIVHEGEDYITVEHEGEECEVTGAGARILKDLLTEPVYSAKEIEEMLWLPCCHVTGMHDPCHFQERGYICEGQKSEALERFCEQLGINPVTKSKETCGWCHDYEEKKTGEGVFLFQSRKENPIPRPLHGNGSKCPIKGCRRCKEVRDKAKTS